MSIFTDRTPAVSTPAVSTTTPTSAPAAKLTLAELASATGRHAEQLCKWAKRPDFPRHAHAAGKPLYVAAEVVQWINTNVRTRKPVTLGTAPPGKAMPAAAPPAPTMPPGVPIVPTAGAPAGSPDAPRLEQSADPLIQTLISGKASALEINRAAMQITARRVGQQAANLNSHDIDDLKKALAELRNAEADYITLEKQKRELIPRDEVRAIVGECCGRLVTVLSTIETAIATEFSLWLADPKVAAATAEERARLIRNYFREKSAAARTEDADELERLLNPRE